MPQFRAKPVVVDAVQWFRNGDHPEDRTAPAPEWIGPDEGHVVLFYRSGGVTNREWAAVHGTRPPLRANEPVCYFYCSHSMSDHGWLETSEGGQRVCPGDYIVTDAQGQRSACKPDVFIARYQAMGPHSHAAPDHDPVGTAG